VLETETLNLAARVKGDVQQIDCRPLRQHSSRTLAASPMDDRTQAGGRPQQRPPEEPSESHETQKRK
jgi:hypothetical protein